MTTIALITGANKGIGFGTARLLGARGMTVLIGARDEARGAEAEQALRDGGADARFVQLDVTDEKSVVRAAEWISAEFGRLDILINNAGVFIERDFVGEADPIHDLESEIAINLTAPIQLTHDVLKRWPAPEAIVFVTSGFALVSPKRAPTYGATKAGLHAFTESLRLQLAARGTHVLELLPPTVDTQMNANFKGKKMPPEKVAEAKLKALEGRGEMVLPGDTALLPLLLRLAPTTAKAMVAKL
jgi:uncharacterized oxidoreductase